jgi:dipeptidyl aminopeptidase/acylaminoacyl peptidase
MRSSEHSIRARCGRLLPLWMLCATSVAAQQAPLLDRTTFFDDPMVADLQISPSGQLLAFRAPYDGTMHLWIGSLSGGVDSAVLIADTQADSFVWSRDSQYLLFLRDSGGDENHHLYAVEADTSGIGVPRDLTPYGAVRVLIYALPDSAPDVVIAGINDRDPQAHDVHRFSIATGERTLVRRNDYEFADWVADLEGNIRLGVRYGPDASVELVRLRGDTLTLVYSCTPDETCTPIRFHRDGRRVYLASDHGDRDLTELVLLNVGTLEEEPVERDPEGRVDLGSVVFSPGSELLVATVYHDDTTRVYGQDSVFTRDLGVLSEALPFAGISFGSASAEGAMWTVHVESDTNPGAWYLFHRWIGTVDLIAVARPGFPQDRLAPTDWIRYPTRGGGQIPALLTLPPDTTLNLPAVLLPHDGPWTSDRSRFDPLVQFLASRGYAVLQPNFRGSSGYGKAFRSAGNDAWGTGVMQHDLIDGARYLIDRGIAQADRIGIVGFGYGGYAALAALVFTPDLFAAGVAVGAMADLPSFLERLPAPERYALPRWYRRVGDPAEPEAHARLESQSPALATSQISKPMLLAHGVNDARVAVSQSDRMVAAVRATGGEADYLRIPDEGHELHHPANRIAFAAALERFLALHLGGIVQEELAADVADRVASMTVDAGGAVGAAALLRTAPLPQADGSRIRRAELVYRISASDGPEAEFVRRIERTSFNRRDIWRVIDSTMVPVFPEFEFDTAGLQADPDAAIPDFAPTGEMEPAADTVDLDRRTLLPIRRRTGGPITLALDFWADSITGEFEVGDFIDDLNISLEAPVFADGAGLELVIAGLPLAEGYQAGLRVFDAQLQQVVPLRLTVTGTTRIETPAGEFDVFQVALSPVDMPDAESRSLQVRQQAPHVMIRGEVRVAGDATGFTQTIELVAVERL